MNLLGSTTNQCPGKSDARHASYAYDGTGLRRSKTVAGVTTTFTWDQSSGVPLLLSDGTNSYIYGADGTPEEQIGPANVVTWYHHDQLGSTRLLSNSSGATVATATYDPYGNLTASSGQLSPLGFAGQYTDAETGFVYVRARYYDPATGQFISRDPLVALTGSAYGYVGGNPLNGTDPTGLDGQSPGGPPSSVQYLSEQNQRLACNGSSKENAVVGFFYRLFTGQPLFPSFWPGAEYRPLKPLHGEGTLDPNSLSYWRDQGTDSIVRSLRPGSQEPLIVKPDGTVMQGNTRIKVLQERGYDVDSLPREIHWDPFGIDPLEGGEPPIEPIP